MKKEITKQHIWESFYELLAVTPFDKLTVERIIAHSGVSKATFYRHFHDKYDVMNYNSAALADRLIGGRNCRDWKEFLYYMFLEIDKDREYYRRAFKSSGQNAHARHLYEYSQGFIRSRYLTATGRDSISPVEACAIRHYCHGSVDTLEDWLRDPEPMAAAQMAQLYYAAMPDFIRSAWGKNE